MKFTAHMALAAALATFAGPLDGRDRSGEIGDEIEQQIVERAQIRPIARSRRPRT